MSAHGQGGYDTACMLCNHRLFEPNVVQVTQGSTTVPVLYWFFLREEHHSQYTRERYKYSRVQYYPGRGTKRKREQLHLYCTTGISRAAQTVATSTSLMEMTKARPQY